VDDDIDISGAKKRDAPMDGRGHVAQQVNFFENTALPNIETSPQKDLEKKRPR
jgi:hypothetical protein